MRVPPGTTGRVADQRADDAIGASQPAVCVGVDGQKLASGSSNPARSAQPRAVAEDREASAAGGDT